MFCYVWGLDLIDFEGAGWLFIVFWAFWPWEFGALRFRKGIKNIYFLKFKKKNFIIDTVGGKPFLVGKKKKEMLLLVLLDYICNATLHFWNFYCPF